MNSKFQVVLYGGCRMKYYLFNYDDVSLMYCDRIVPKEEIICEFEFNGFAYFLSDKEIITVSATQRRKCIEQFSKWIKQFNLNRKYILRYSNIWLYERDCYELLSDYLTWEANKNGDTYAEVICKSDNLKETVNEIIKSLAKERLDVQSRDLIIEIEKGMNEDKLDVEKIREEVQEVTQKIYNKTFEWID